MSRSGYTDDADDIRALNMWRGAVDRSLKGKRGQAFLREIIAALDAMPIKELAADSLVTAEGEFCTLGAVGAARGMDMSTLDPEDWDAVAKAFGIAPAMAREIVFENDEHNDGSILVEAEICGPMRRPERHYRARFMPDPNAAAKRWRTMRQWAAGHTKECRNG